MKTILIKKAGKESKYITDGSRIWKIIVRNGVECKQAYIFKVCETCKNKFPASHKKQTYCSAKCIKNHMDFSWRKGLKFPNEKGGYGSKRINTKGYVEVWMPGHILADKKRRVLEHRLVAFRENPRYDPMDKSLSVHHINGIKTDNRPENLVVIHKFTHNSLHKSEEVIVRKRDSLGRFL